MNNEKQRKNSSPKDSIDDEFIKGISRTDSLKRLGASKQKNQPSMDLQEMNILGLKDYYLNSESKDTSTQLEYRSDPQQANHNLDQLGQKLNEVIGQYLAEITQQSRFSLDSLSLQNSESLDEEHQQQIIDWELNTIRQKIYRNIVEKINLSVIQSVQTQNSFSESHLMTSGAQISQISFKSPPKSLAHSLVDINMQMQRKIEEQVNSLNEYDSDLSKEEILNKLKMSIQINSQLLSMNSQLREELRNKDQIDIIQSEYEQMKIENAKLIQENLQLKKQMGQDQT